MSEKRAKGCLVAAVLWCVILLLLGVGYRFLVHPYLREKLKGDTGSTSQYEEEITVAADAFSGYAILRSPVLRNALRDEGVKLTVRDDGADYFARLKALQQGEVQAAVFTVDSLLSTGARLGEFPGTIVLVIDETKGSDAILARESAFASLQDLNDPAARVVLTPNSPSEFLARVVIAHFNLPNLSEDWLAPAAGPDEVYAQLVTAGPSQKRAFVLWEPYVTKARSLPGVKVLLDSSKLRGYIVDVLAVQRQFLRDRPERVRLLLEAYLRAAYYYAQQPDGLVKLVQEDARQTGAESLDEAQARRIVQGIHWKNTLENYAHLGQSSGAAAGGVQHLEDIVGNIVDVLRRTKALDRDPLDGQYHTLFYNQILAAMKRDGFHPGKGLSLVPGLGPGAGELEAIREPTARALTDAQWRALLPVGELRMEPIAFLRGSARISVSSERDLGALAKRLQSFPEFYLRVIGHTRPEGDAEANQRLAQARADAAADYLRSQGISPDRMRAEAAPDLNAAGVGQSVSFFVGQSPY